MTDPPDDSTTIDDVAAELDDPTPADTTGDDPDGGDDEPAAYTGLCHGGPYDGRTMTSRFPLGFLLVDRPTLRAWWYDFAAGAFNCRTPEAINSVSVDRLGVALDSHFDVIAYDSQAPRP